jgi:hypothetical protein
LGGFSLSPSGVRLADDFRDNLIIDRYDGAFLTMRGSKTAHMRSENSEDVVTWNAFRSLAQVDPTFWYVRLYQRAFGEAPDHAPTGAHVRLWTRLAPPPGLRAFQKDEGESEIDVLIETEHAVWAIEAKLGADISEGTKSNATRDQVLRNLDVGSWYAGVRKFYFALLVLRPDRSPKGIGLVERYRAVRDEFIDGLPHRPDRLRNLRHLGVLTWADVLAVLSDCAHEAPRPDERGHARRAVEWLSAHVEGL